MANVRDELNAWHPLWRTFLGDMVDDQGYLTLPNCSTDSENRMPECEANFRWVKDRWYYETAGNGNVTFGGASWERGDFAVHLSRPAPDGFINALRVMFEGDSVDPAMVRELIGEWCERAYMGSESPYREPECERVADVVENLRGARPSEGVLRRAMARYCESDCQWEWSGETVWFDDDAMVRAVVEVMDEDAGVSGK